MRKTSHDGGDSTSITSGAENEFKKSAMKPRKSSFKRKAPNFSQESDDTVIEPLLQRDKEKTEATQSAKYFIKGKTDSLLDKESDNKAKTTTTAFCGTTESLLSVKDDGIKTTSVVAPIHNYMNTNVFHTHDNIKANVTTKSQILVEIDGCKQSGYHPSPLIFTTAKIHTDGKSKAMEPVQMTPVPILSTIEVSMTKEGNFTTNEKKISNGSSLINAVYSPIPLNKGKEERVVPSTVLSTTENKDTFGKATTTTSASKFSNNTSVQNSSLEKSLPSTTSKPLSIISNIKDKQETTIEIQKEPALPKNIQPIKTFNLDNVKNSVTVKTTTPSFGKANVVETKLAKTSQGDSQTDKSQINKIDANSGKASTSANSSNSTNSANNIKTPIASKNAIGISNPVKNVENTAANKQLQRQKTTTEEGSNLESKIKPNIERSDDSNVKVPPSKEVSSHPKVIDSSDKLPKCSANLNSKSVSNVPTFTSVSLSNTVTIPTNISSKSTTPLSVTEKNVSSVTTSTNVVSHINKTIAATTGTTSSTAVAQTSTATLAKTSAIPTSISTVKSSGATSVKPASSGGKSVLSKTPSVTTSAAIKTTSVSSVKSPSTVPTTKPSPAVTTASITAATKAAISSTSKTAVTKMPSVTTAIKTTSVSSITSTKPSPTTSQVTVSTIPPKASASSSGAIKVPVVTTAITTTPVSTVASTTATSQNMTSAQMSVNKQPITTNVKSPSTSTVVKLPSVTIFGKSSTVNSSAVPSTNASVKSPNNNTTPMSVILKPPTASIAKTVPSVATSTKTSSVSSSPSTVTAATLKSPQASTSATTVTKESATSAKKPSAVKTQPSTAKALPVSSTVTTTSKQPSVDKNVSAKTPSVTTSIKAPSVTSVTTSVKTPSVTSVSKATTVTAPKSTAVKSAQVSSSKSASVAGASTSVPRPSESIKKDASKSSENNKDGKPSKGEH